MIITIASRQYEITVAIALIENTSDAKSDIFSQSSRYFEPSLIANVLIPSPAIKVKYEITDVQKLYIPIFSTPRTRVIYGNVISGKIILHIV